MQLQATKAFIDQQLDRAVTAVPVAVRFLRRIDATVVQGQELLRTFLRLLGTTLSRRTTLTFVAAEMRHRIDAILPHGELVVRTVRQLFGNLSPRKTTLIFVAAGLIGLALILLLLLEISLRMELAKEARDAVIDATPAPSVNLQKMEFTESFPIQPASSTSLQSVDQLGAPGATPSSDYSETLGQVFQEPVPLPRSRKAR
jgi:hypothetical protein